MTTTTPALTTTPTAITTRAGRPDTPTKRFVTVHGQRMAYTDTGRGDPVVFLHGNPTSSYLWRNIIPLVAGQGRCLAPDLIGMGDSDKLPNPGPGSYIFAQHRHHLDAWFDTLLTTDDPDSTGSGTGTGKVTLVVHDWGSALGFDWAARHPDRVAGIAYLEAIVTPLHAADLGPARPLFEALRSPAGDKMVLEDNMFIEQVLPVGVLAPLDPPVLAEYRRPFIAPGEARRPTLAWPRQIPLDGQPADVAAIVTAYGAWMATSPVPKLFINADPGAGLTGAAREFCRTWPNQTEHTVPGLHLLPEDSPTEIGHALTEWLPTTRGPA